ncbi:unnamed protein product [Blepharisma stoltei]|uniref:U-box domain-containing protein n=1 Tax=Blepharisma stoltei TaxID=1481888 RepID=A0AAU9J8G2_9CILI|nr:unnamed protein product [Blepharisma stoltei]
MSQKLIEENIPDCFLCPITQELMQDPVIAADGHTYERKAIKRWLKTGNRRSPLTNESLTNMTFIENYLARSLIHEFIENQTKTTQSCDLIRNKEVEFKSKEKCLKDEINKKSQEINSLLSRLETQRKTKKRHTIFDYTAFIVILGMLFYNSADRFVKSSEIYSSKFNTIEFESSKLVLAQPVEYQSSKISATSKDGSHYAYADSNYIFVINTATNENEISLRHNSSEITFIQFSNSGKLLASGNRDNEVTLWSLESKKKIKDFMGHKKAISAIDISADEKLVVSGGWDGKVILWDIESQHQNGIFGKMNDKTSWVTAIKFSPDGKLIASSHGDFAINIWNIADKKIIKQIKGHQNWIQSVAFSDCGKFLNSKSIDGTIIITKIFN